MVRTGNVVPCSLLPVMAIMYVHLVDHYLTLGCWYHGLPPALVFVLVFRQFNAFPYACVNAGVDSQLLNGMRVPSCTLNQTL